MLDRRGFLQTTAGASLALAGLQNLIPAWAQGELKTDPVRKHVLSGRAFDLRIAYRPVRINGIYGRAITINDYLPGPLLRWREGQAVTIRVTNLLDEDTSIHWHGILVPSVMDGVPGISFPGIKSGETFSYRFPVHQAGTYWYHSHSGLQEQIGHYGPLIIDPEQDDPFAYERDYVMILSDWTFEDPKRVFARLKKNSDSYNFQKRTFSDFFSDIGTQGLSPTIKDRMMWGNMRMSATDIADVSGSTYTYLVNGHAPKDNWTALFRLGERVRLRFINASAMTFFNVRVPGLSMRVVQADGQNVQPVDVEEFQLGIAETCDVIVQPEQDQAYTVMCETMDRSGYARASLAPRVGMQAQVPPLRPRPLLTMRDMGMAHEKNRTINQLSGGGHVMDDRSGNRSADENQHGMMKPLQEQKQVGSVHQHRRRGIRRLHDPGTGLEQMAHKVLTYADLKSLDPNPDSRPPEREIEVHLTGNMERYLWSFDGIRFSQLEQPILFYKDERLRLTMINDTMMAHPIHLHGMFFEIVTGNHHYQPRKHTIVVKPAERLSVDITADAPGEWAFHCHLLYHMHAGMFHSVSVREKDISS